MVTRLLYAVLWMLLALITSHAAAAQVEAAIEQASSLENQPIEGTLTITHDSQEAVDPSAFFMDGQPLTASLLQSSTMPSGLQKTAVSIYRFTLPAQPKGLYVLPSITVKVGNQTLQSTPSAYEVHSTPAANPKSGPAVTPSAQAVSTNPKRAPPLIFRLESKVEGPSTLYPGQRTELFYRISYNRSVDLTESTLPFIHATPFKKVGDARIKDYQNGDVTVQEIVQEIEASQIGSFTLGPSKIAGYAYQINMFGKKAYQEPLLQADSPAVQVEVKPFPAEGRPGSFNGALGEIRVALKMLTPSTLRLGDKVELEMSISGVSNLAELRLPDFHCQPGFSGFFQFSDLPPTGELKNDVKLFRIELNPISTFVQAVPSFELASFDPATTRYVVQKTPLIPLSLQSPPLNDSPPQDLALPAEDLNEKLLWNPADWPLTPLEIKGVPPLGGHLTPSLLQTPWVLLILPFGCGWLWLQWHLKRKLSKRPRLLKKQSDSLLEKAIKDKKLPAQQIVQLIEKASWWKIWEEEILPLKQISLEHLPKQGPLGDLRAFIVYLQSLQYSPHQDFAVPDLLHRAQQLFSTNFNRSEP